MIKTPQSLKMQLQEFKLKNKGYIIQVNSTLLQNFISLFWGIHKLLFSRYFDSNSVMAVYKTIGILNSMINHTEQVTSLR